MLFGGIPKEKLSAVKAILEKDTSLSQKQLHKQKKDLSEDPWQDLLEDDSE